ncbi:MAG: DegV family protein [Chloroflexota bacterium]|nr:DegV family protein [Chloroflexota bacterium]
MAKASEQRIAVVTDSTADLPPDVAEANNIHVIPLTVIMGDKTWLDGVELDATSFYQLLQTSSDHPSTSQPNVAAFESLFSELARTHDGIVAVLISEELSGTLASARGAQQNLPDLPLKIIDTRSVSSGIGLIALAAAREAAAGGDLDSVAQAASSLVDKMVFYFMVDTLEYLHRGGRIGTAGKLLGSVLNLKPILQVKDGIVQPLTRVRTRQKALAKLMELMAEQIGPDSKLHLGVFHAADPQAGERLQKELEERFKPVEMLFSQVGPVVGAHVGPGTVGVAFYVE